MRKSTRATIREVAEACGVSAMTVSYVLNGKREKVGTDTCARVLKAVRDLNYAPTSLSVPPPHALQTATMGVVSDMSGMYLMDTGGGYVNAILSGILERSDELQHNITLFSSRLLHTDIHRSIRVYCDGRCDGLLVFSPIRNSPLITALSERGTPFVTIGNLPLDTRVSGVDTDDVSVGEAATNYLLDRGHRRIAYVNMLECIESSNRRGQGYRKALRAHGVTVSSEDFIDWTTPNDGRKISVEDTCRRAVFNAMRQPADTRPTALFCFNDLFAFWCLDSIRDAGLRVPEDVSVMGVDDALNPSAQERQLTTLRQPFARIGSRAVDILLSHISGEVPAPTRELLPSEMVVRKTARDIT